MRTPGGAAGAGWESACAVADAVLYEGYLLYPYRRSSGKNRVRWQFGVLAPRDWVERRGPVPESVVGAVDTWRQRTECLLLAGPRARLRVRLRFLQAQHRSVQRRTPPDGRFVEVDALDAGELRYLTFEEAVPREFDLDFAPGRSGAEREESITVEGGELIEPLPGVAGDARVVRTRRPLSARVRLVVAEDTGPRGLRRVRVEVRNTVTDQPVDAPRTEVLRRSLIATHCLLRVRDGEFLSLLDPPPWAAGAVERCSNLHTFPVLAGREGERDVMLSAPILLYDHPGISPESPGELFDSCEIDEILSLRALTLTDAEAREARATDARAGAILDRVSALPEEAFARMHGVLRSIRPAVQSGPDQASEPGGR